MKRTASFLLALILLFCMSASANTSETSENIRKTPVEALLENSITKTEKGSILLIGGTVAHMWQNVFAYDMYPKKTGILTVDGSLSADWLNHHALLRNYLPRAVVWCLEGNDDSEAAALLAQNLVNGLGGAKVYAVSAVGGANAAKVNAAVSAVAGIAYIDVYTSILLEDGTVNPEYAGEGGITKMALQLISSKVSTRVNLDYPAKAPTAPEKPIVPDTSESEDEGGSYRWLIPVAILLVGLIIGIDCARTAAVNDRRRKVKRQK